MRAWVAYRTFRTPDRDVRFYTVRNVLGADLRNSNSNFNLRSTLLALETFIRPTHRFYVATTGTTRQTNQPNHNKGC